METDCLDGFANLNKHQLYLKWHVEEYIVHFQSSLLRVFNNAKMRKTAKLMRGSLLGGNTFLQWTKLHKNYDLFDSFSVCFFSVSSYSGQWNWVMKMIFQNIFKNYHTRASNNRGYYFFSFYHMSAFFMFGRIPLKSHGCYSSAVIIQEWLLLARTVLSNQ